MEISLVSVWNVHFRGGEVSKSEARSGETYMVMTRSWNGLLILMTEAGGANWGQLPNCETCGRSMRRLVLSSTGFCKSRSQSQ